LAHLALVRGDTARARSQLQAALESDPGHFAARRLEAHLLRREGDLPAARAHLAHWVELTAGEPAVASADWYDAVLDLAILETSAGRVEAAAEALARLDAPRPGGAGWAQVGEATARRGLLLAAVLASDEGRHEQALVLAREARAGLQPASSLYGLALVQEAELLELYLARPEQAAYAWGLVLERFGTALDTGGLAAGGDSEFDELLRVLGARVRLARLEAAGVVPAEAQP
jgi:tetratricopeptide (TPR) repeat protein